MAIFEYQAKEGPTKIVTGTIHARDKAEAVMKLSDKGIIPLSVTESSGTGRQKIVNFFRGITQRDIYITTYQLVELIASGLALHSALATIASQVTKPQMQRVFYDIEKQVTEGRSFSESLATHPEIFSPFYVNMVKAGEAGGQLPEVLEQLAIVNEKEYDLRTRIKQALAYPSLIAIAGVLTIIAILTFVIPRLESMYSDIGKGLPFITSVVISVSFFLRDFWWLIGIGVVAVFVYAMHISRNTLKMGQFIDAVLLKIPIWGELVKKEEISRFVRSLAMLFTSGVSILDALDISKDILRSNKMKQDIMRVHEDVRNGGSLHESLAKSDTFSLFVVNMVATGEKTGALDRSLSRVVILYEKEIDSTVKTITTLIEPLLVLLVGFVVGIIVISMLLPIFQINVFIQ
jgi:type II secretory pathway component PulF